MEGAKCGLYRRYASSAIQFCDEMKVPVKMARRVSKFRLLSLRVRGWTHVTARGLTFPLFLLNHPSSARDLVVCGSWGAITLRIKLPTYIGILMWIKIFFQSIFTQLCLHLCYIDSLYVYVCIQARVFTHTHTRALVSNGIFRWPNERQLF